MSDLPIRQIFIVDLVKQIYSNYIKSIILLMRINLSILQVHEKFYKLLGSYYISEYIKIKLPILKQEFGKKEIYAEKFKYHILWGIVHLLRKKYADDIVASIIMKRMISKGAYILPQENENKEHKFYIYFKKVVKAIEKKIEEIQNDKKEKDEPFVIRNYQHDGKFTNKLTLELDYIDKDELPELVEN